MAKQKKKITTSAPKAVAKKSSSLPSFPGFTKYFPFVITAVFFVLSFIGILNHEMWRDEYQAWLLARDSHSLSEFMQNMKYEGHPALWHSFLYVITAFTHDPFWMQVFHILISTSMVFLFNRYSPFSLPEKILFTFGYYSFFEYNLISRSYALGLLFVVVFCILYKNRHKYYLPISIALFLMANTQISGLMLAMSFGGILFLDYLLKRKSAEVQKVPIIQVLAAGLIIVAGCAASLWQIYPEPDNTFPVSRPLELFDPVRIKNLSARMMDAYYALPNLKIPYFWNSNQFEITSMLNGVIVTDLNPVWPLLTFFVFSLYFLRKPLMFLLYVLGTIGLLGFFYYSGLFYQRYSGHIFILLFATMWLSYYHEEVKLTPQFLNPIAVFGKKTGRYLFILLLAIGFIGGVGSYYQDLTHTFSASKDAAEFLVKNKLEKLDMLGATDFTTSNIAALLDRRIYYPQMKDTGSFVIWNKKRKDTYNLNHVADWMEETEKKGAKSMIVILDEQPMIREAGATVDTPLKDGLITGNLYIQLLQAIPAGIVKDEKYFIYLVEERKM